MAERLRASVLLANVAIVVLPHVILETRVARKRLATPSDMTPVKVGANLMSWVPCVGHYGRKGAIFSNTATWRTCAVASRHGGAAREREAASSSQTIFRSR